MKNTIVCACILLAVSTVSNALAQQKSNITIEERVEMMGGFVVKPGSQQGSVSFISTQDSVDIEKSCSNIISVVESQLKIKILFSKSQVDTPFALKDKSGSQFAVVVVDDPEQPSMTIYPEDCVATVNVAKYSVGLKLPADRLRYERRCSKGVLKAFTLLCSGGGSQYPGNVATKRRPQDLDGAVDTLPVDIQQAMKNYLASAGVTPIVRTVYKRACEQGWAPLPTNEIQKAIWNKIHEVPTSPMVIKPEKHPAK